MPKTGGLEVPTKGAGLSACPIVIQCLRLARVAFHLFWGVLRAALWLPRVSSAKRAWIIQSWARTLLHIFGVRFTLPEALPEPLRHGTLFVSNHVSWLDIWVLMALHPVRFISKADVRNWPLIGWLAQQVGTLFIQRERRQHTVAIVEEAQAALTQGDCVALFPEGTTSDGLHLLCFHASLMQAAVATEAPLALFAIRYFLADGTADPAPAFIGDMTLLESLRKILARRYIQAELIYIGVLDSKGKTRRELALAAEVAIATALNLPAPHKALEIPADLADAGQTTVHPKGNPYPAPHAGRPH